VLHRKNALFYKTLPDLPVGDLFMGLIHTCRLRGARSLDYLTELQRHALELETSPADWMPWNYLETMAGFDPPAEPLYMMVRSHGPKGLA
jgi:transposase